MRGEEEREEDDTREDFFVYVPWEADREEYVELTGL